MAAWLKTYDPVGRNAYDESAAGQNCCALIVKQNPETRLRPQFGAKPYDRSGRNAYDAKSATPKIHALVVRNRVPISAHPLTPVTNATTAQQFGYEIRRQFGPLPKILTRTMWQILRSEKNR